MNTAFTVRAFIGPTQSAGTGGGLFSVDAGLNVGFGTTAPSPVSTFNATSTESGSSSLGNVFIVASTTNPGVGVKNLTSGHSYIWSARNFGNLQLYRESGAPDNLPGFVVMDINKYGSVGIGIKATSTGVSERLIVGGDIRTVSGAFRGSGAFLSSIDAANVLAGPFTTANYAFPLELAVGTSTTANLPSTLYTLGTARITGTTTLATTAGNVGIGTTIVGAKLHSLSTTEQLRLGYDASNYNSFTVGAAGSLTLAAVGTNPNITLTPGGTGYTILNGNVGIATTSPAYKLDVVGTSRFTQPVIVGTPTTDGHAATKNYVDTAITSGNSGAWLVSGTNIYPSSTTWKVAIGTTTATESLEVGTGVTNSALIKGNISAGVYYDVANSAYYFDPAANQQPYSLVTAGAVGIATTSPAYMLDVVGTMRVTGTSTLQGNLSFGGAAVTNLNMNNNNLLAVNKITAATIDPLYEIDGKKYATYASAIAGGVKEEYIAKAELLPISSLKSKISNLSDKYGYTIDFDNIERGSDLWVWKNAVDFSADNIDVFITPIGVSAPVSYEIKGNTIIFSAQPNYNLITTNYNELPASIPISFRLVGKRFDWKNWPTYVKNQDEKPSFIIK